MAEERSFLRVHQVTAARTAPASAPYQDRLAAPHTDQWSSACVFVPLCRRLGALAWPSPCRRPRAPRPATSPTGSWAWTGAPVGHPPRPGRRLHPRGRGRRPGLLRTGLRPHNDTDEWVMVFTEPDCTGDSWTLRPHGNPTTENLKLRSPSTSPASSSARRLARPHRDRGVVAGERCQVRRSAAANGDFCPARGASESPGCTRTEPRRRGIAGTPAGHDPFAAQGVGVRAEIARYATQEEPAFRPMTAPDLPPRLGSLTFHGPLSEARSRTHRRSSRRHLARHGPRHRLRLGRTAARVVESVPGSTGVGSTSTPRTWRGAGTLRRNARAR